MWIWALAGCWSGSQDLTSEPEGADALALAEARRLAEAAAEQLRAQMVQEMGNPGPSDAIVDGSIEAEVLMAHVDVPPGGNGRVGHSGMRPRDRANQSPAWVQAWIDAHADREFADVQGFERIEQGEGEARVARILAPIPILDGCLQCHGDESQIPARIRTRLEARYPDDQATGYRVGDLAGALWVEIPVED